MLRLDSGSRSTRPTATSETTNCLDVSWNCSDFPKEILSQSMLQSPRTSSGRMRRWHMRLWSWILRHRLLPARHQSNIGSRRRRLRLTYVSSVAVCALLFADTHSLYPGNASTETALCTDRGCYQSCVYGGHCSSESVCVCKAQASRPHVRADKRGASINVTESRIFSRESPYLNSTQSTAASDLLRPLGRTTTASFPVRLKGCNDPAIVCDRSGNIVEINHAIAPKLRSPSKGHSIDGENLLRLPVLKSLELNGCHLGGTVPRELGSLKMLTSVSLFDNQLTGTLPPSLGSLTNIRALVLAKNVFTGTIPASTLALSKIQLLDVGHNHLHGKIPAGMVESFRQLDRLRLDNNGASFQVLLRVSVLVIVNSDLDLLPLVLQTLRQVLIQLSLPAFEFSALTTIHAPT